MKPYIRHRGIVRRVCIIALLLLGGGTASLVAGCDTAVSTAVLSSLQDMSTSLVDAFFQTIENQLEATGTSTTSTTDTTTTTDTTSSGT